MAKKLTPGQEYKRETDISGIADAGALEAPKGSEVYKKAIAAQKAGEKERTGGAGSWLFEQVTRTGSDSASAAAAEKAAANEQRLAMQGAVSDALQNVMTMLFPSNTIPIYDQSISAGLNTLQGSLSGTNPGLASLAAQGGNNPAMQAALSQAQATGAATSGYSLGQISSGMGNVANQEQQTNQLFEQHLPGLLNAAGANDLAASYATTLSNALKYQQIYQAGINIGDVPKALVPFAEAAAGNAINIAGLTASQEGGSGPGASQATNPLVAQAGSLAPSTTPVYSNG